jgi:uncharacterized damage-inducible protein DinB
MLKDGLHNKLQSTEDYFSKTLSVAEEKDSAFKPAEGMFTLAQQVAHVAQTNDWFLEGMFGTFREDFDVLEQEVYKITSLNGAKAWLDRSFEAFHDKLDASDEDVLKERRAPGAIMGGVPRYIVVGALADHCAHHRGSLATYLRILGKEPEMPYV